jgi:Integrase core domain.
MTWNPNHFQTYDEFESPKTVHGIGDSAILAYGKGTVRLQTTTTNVNNTHDIHDVWYVPQLEDSIISKHWTKLQNLKTTLDDDEEIILSSTIPGSSFCMQSQSINRITTFINVRCLQFDPNQSIAIPETTTTRTMITYTRRSTPITVSVTPRQARQCFHCGSYGNCPHVHAQLMHERLGHASAQRLLAFGITHFLPGDCHNCILGKQTRNPFPRLQNEPNEPLSRVYSDLCMDISPPSWPHRYTHFITFTDQCTRYTWVYAITNKSNATILAIIKKWLPLVKNESNRKLKILRTDQGNEYIDKTTFAPYLESKGITHEDTPAYSSSSNGTAERINRTLLDMVRPMLNKSKLPHSFWVEALNTAVKIRNRLPTSSLPGNISPHEAWFGNRPTIDHFRQFGCIAYHRIPKKHSRISSSKIAPRSAVFSAISPSQSTVSGNPNHVESSFHAMLSLKKVNFSIEKHFSTSQILTTSSKQLHPRLLILTKILDLIQTSLCTSLKNLL